MPAPRFAQDFRQVDAARCTSGTLAPTNHAAAALFNTSSQYIVRVWGMNNGSATGWAFRNTQTRLTNQAAGTVAAIFTGEPVPGIAVDTDDLVSVGSFDFEMAGNPTGNLFVASPIPWALLRPGFGLLAIQIGTGGSPIISWLVDWCYPGDLFFPHIGDPDIDRGV